MAFRCPFDPAFFDLVTWRVRMPDSYSEDEMVWENVTEWETNTLLDLYMEHFGAIDAAAEE